jgi:hypothetical protein
MPNAEWRVRNSAVQVPHSALVVGLLAAGPDLISSARKRLAQEFGPVAEQSDPIAFTFTDYYQAEMGADLLRTWLGFVRLQPLDKLADIKRRTNALEDQLRNANGQRQVNLDPGLLSPHNLVLASTKDYSHRVYLGQGIFAEVTLIYEHGQFQPLRWTYPDYQSPVALTFFRAVRERLLGKQRK